MKLAVYLKQQQKKVMTSSEMPSLLKSILLNKEEYKSNKTISKFLSSSSSSSSSLQYNTATKIVKGDYFVCLQINLNVGYPKKTEFIICEDPELSEIKYYLNDKVNFYSY